MRIRRLLAPAHVHAEPAPRWVASVIGLSTALTVGAAAGVPAIGSAVASPGAAARQSSTIVQQADASVPFGDRWVAAHADAKTRGWSTYWLGYTVRPTAGLRGFIYSDRSATARGNGLRFSGRFSGNVDGLHFPGVPLAPLLGGGDPGSVKLLFSFAGGRATPAFSRLHASTFVLPVDLEARPIVWLGQATAAESLPIVERLYASEGRQDEKSDLVTAIGLHDDSARVVPALVKILTGSDAPSVRAEAAERLGWHSVPAALAALERAARTDRAFEVRQEAVEAIGDLTLADATPTLIALAKTLDDREARREAVETLGQRPEAAARDALVALARSDRDVDVQREAVESLGNRKEPESVTALTEIARAHAAVEVRREAVETLGEAMPADQAVAFLARVARDDADADVQREAVEALGELEGGRGLAEVARLALAHPVRDVQREAIETLGEHAPATTAIDVLTRIVNGDVGEDVRREALEALAELSDGAGVPALVDVARSHPDRDVRAEALKQLVESDDPRARAVFDRALAKPER